MWSVALAVVGWALGWVVFGRPRRLAGSTVAARPARTPSTEPSMSIIIPARNEALSLPLLLGDLKDGRPPGTEVIVVDDASGDDTFTLAEGFAEVTVLRAGDRPPGWAGKPWACHVGAAAARAERLCFIDADVRVRPGALEAVAGQLDAHGGLVSVQPWHATEEPYEQASALFGVVAFMGTGAGGRDEPTGAFGPLLMTGRADYDRTGGHGGVRGEVVEDMALARHYSDAALPVRVLTGGDDVTFRMYPQGPRTLVEGWTKNFATGAAGTHVPRFLAIATWLAAMGTTVVFGWDALSGSRPALLALACFAAFAAQLRVMFAPLGRFGTATALAYPVLLVIFFAMFFRSLWFTLVRREVRWRGRAVPIGSPGGLP